MVRFSFKAGTVTHRVLDQDMNMTMNMGAKDMVTNIKMSMWMTASIVAVKGNTADIEQKITRMKAFADSITMKVNYDSDDDETDAGPLEAIEDMVGEQITMKLSDQGKISDVKLPDDVELYQQAGVDMAQIMAQTVTQLPDHPIAVGETWKVPQTTEMGELGEMKSETTYKLIAITKDFITLSQTMSFDLDGVQIPGGASLDEMRAIGTSKIDLRTGMPAEMDLTMTTKMGGPMTMVMTMKQTMKPAKKPAAKSAKEGDAKDKEAPKAEQPNNTGK